MSGTNEIRAVAELRRSGRSLTGYAATFDTEARIGNFTEVVRAGAFRDSLAENRDILAMVDHDATRVLGRTRTGTLELREDEKGLAFSLDVPDTQAGNDVLALAERGDLGGMSFGFIPTDERWEGRTRELHGIDLREVSVVAAWPAYDGTSVAPRASAPTLARARRYLETL
jgi:hypothetical protein